MDLALNDYFLVCVQIVRLSSSSLIMAASIIQGVFLLDCPSLNHCTQSEDVRMSKMEEQYIMYQESELGTHMKFRAMLLILKCGVSRHNQRT